MRNLLLFTLMIGAIGCATDSDAARDADLARREAARDTNMFQRQAEQEKQDFEEP